MRVRTAVLAAVIAGTSLGGTAPVPAHSQTDLPVWGAALASGSPRLALYSLATRRPPGAIGTVHALAGPQGLTFPAAGGAPRRVGGGLSAYPVLAWDGNINGGIPSDTITIIGLPFTISPASRAKSGIVAGAGIGGGISYAVARGTVVGLNAQASTARSQVHDLSRTAASASLCVSRFVEGWTFLDLCGAAIYQKRELSTTNERNLSLRASRLFPLGASDHEVGLKVTAADRRSYRQTTWDMDWRGAFADVGVISLRIGIGEDVAGVQALRDRVEVGLTRPVFGRPTTVSAGIEREAGSSLFGVARQDRTVTLSLRRPVTDRITARIGVERTRSTIDAFSEDAVTLDVEFAGLRF